MKAAWVYLFLAACATKPAHAPIQGLAPAPAIEQSATGSAVSTSDKQNSAKLNKALDRAQKSIDNFKAKEKEKTK